MATAQYIDLADTWLRFQPNGGASDPLSDPLYIVTVHHKSQKTNTFLPTSGNKESSVLSSERDKSHKARSPTSQPMNWSTTNSFAYAQSMSKNIRAGVQIDSINSKTYSNPLSHYSDTQSLRMHTMLNPYDNVPS